MASARPRSRRACSMRVRCWPSWFQRRSGGPSVASFRFTDDDRVHTCLSSDIVNPIDEPACGVQFPTRSAMRTHPPAGRLAAGVDDLWPEPFGKPRSRDLAVMGSKAEPATAPKSAAEAPVLASAAEASIWPCVSISERIERGRARFRYQQYD